MGALNEISTFYVVVAVLWATYQGFRGAVEQQLNHFSRVRDAQKGTWEEPRDPKWECWQRWVVLYVHDFAFRFICTFAGFVALYVANMLAGDLGKLRELSAQSSALVAFLFLVGVIGVGGQLHYVILLGKVPK